MAGQDTVHSLLNVPEGFKLARARFEAQDSMTGPWSHLPERLEERGRRSREPGIEGEELEPLSERPAAPSLRSLNSPPSYAPAPYQPHPVH
jgi:hypothetical protein